MAGGGCRERRCHDGEWYLGEQISIRLPTVQFMVDRLLELGPGAYMFKTDLAQGYRQLRIDPSDWPLLGFAEKTEEGANVSLDALQSIMAELGVVL